MTAQRKGTAIAMTEDERDTFLRTQPVCRVATVGANGRPHASALWFVWDGTALWLNSLTRSQRWADIARDPAQGNPGEDRELGLRQAPPVQVTYMGRWNVDVKACV